MTPANIDFKVITHSFKPSVGLAEAIARTLLVDFIEDSLNKAIRDGDTEKVKLQVIQKLVDFVFNSKNKELSKKRRSKK